jgi:Leucine-rich repeat (LRR) protein
MFIAKDTRKIAEIVAARDENGMGAKKFKLARRRQEFKSGHINQLVRGSSKTRGLQAAEMVNLYNNGLSTVRGIHAFASAENLLHLNLGCNALKEIPPEITQLRALRELWLDDNLFEELPTPVLELEELRVLRLSGNRLTSLPAQIRMLRLLEDLSCDANEVGDLPETVNELVNLRNLNVRQNAISSLPELGDLKHLEILIASSNCLESLETVSLEKLTSLRKLFINGNKINEFPAKDIIALAKDGCLDKANFANNCLKLPLPAEIISELGDKLIV